MLQKFSRSLFLFGIALRPFLSSRVYPIGDIFLSGLLVVAGTLIIAGDIKVLRAQRAAPALALFLAALLVSIAFSQDRAQSFSQFYRYATALIVFLAASSLARSAPRAVLRILLLSASLVALYALRWVIHGLPYALEYMGNLTIRDDFAMEYLSRGRAFMPFVFPSSLGGYLITLIPLGVAFLINREQKKKVDSIRPIDLRLIAVATSVTLMTLSLLASQSLGAILSLAAAVIFTALAMKTLKLNRGTSLLLIFLAAGLLLIAVERQLTPHVLSRPLLSLRDRLSYWQQAFSVIRQHPLVGYGLGNYPFFRSVSPHNSLLQLWAEAGALGLGAFLFFVSRAFRSPSTSLAKEERVIYAGLFTGFLAFLLQNGLDFTFFQPEVCLSWWVVAGLLTSLGAANGDPASGNQG